MDEKWGGKQRKRGAKRTRGEGRVMEKRIKGVKH